MNKEIERKIEKVNILDTHSQILSIIRDSRTVSFEMEQIKKIILPDCERLAEEAIIELYELARGFSTEEIETIIRKVNPGFIRMSLRNIQKEIK